MEEDFFKKQTPSSRIKASIVAEYFPQYCRILLTKPQHLIRYLDLFAGPGLYEDQNLSTPLLIAQACAKDANLSQKVHLLFNDNKYSKELESNFNERFQPGTFKYLPRFGDRTVGEDEAINRFLTTVVGKPNPKPTLLFFDPFGYKGIDTLALATFLGNWGNELFLFVNTKRINAAITNNKFEDLMQSLFPTSIEQLRQDKKYKASVYERLALIMDNLANEFIKAIPGTLYHCAFKFQEEDSKATSHFIIHFTKHQRGYELIKQVYHDFDNIGAALEKDGVYTFDAKKMDQKGSALTFGDSNVAALSSQLEKAFKGRKLTARELFEEHHPTSKFCGTHYNKTLRKMVDDGKVKAHFTDSVNHKVSVLINDYCILEFI
jgi:three-Cys-motif partner protein